MRVQQIVDGHFKDKDPSSGKDSSAVGHSSNNQEEKATESGKFTPRSAYVLMLEEICADMRRCQVGTQSITQFVKFISSPQCEVVPAAIRGSDSAESQEF